MSRIKRLKTLFMALTVLSSADLANAQQTTPSVITALTALDYAEIQQLSSRYALAIDLCTNSGYDYADLFAMNGEFAIADSWGAVPEQRRFRTTGRDALAAAAGGGPDGCRDPATLMGYGISHIIVNHVITATADGASGRSYLLAIGVGGQATQIELQGGYEDQYVRTADGWRFAARIHVFPDIENSVQFGGAGR